MAFADRQTDRQTERQADSHDDRTDRQTDTPTGGQSSQAGHRPPSYGAAQPQDRLCRKKLSGHPPGLPLPGRASHETGRDSLTLLRNDNLLVLSCRILLPLSPPRPRPRTRLLLVECYTTPGCSVAGQGVRAYARRLGRRPPGTTTTTTATQTPPPQTPMQYVLHHPPARPAHRARLPARCPLPKTRKSTLQKEPRRLVRPRQLRL